LNYASVLSVLISIKELATKEAGLQKEAPVLIKKTLMIDSIRNIRSKSSLAKRSKWSVSRRKCRLVHSCPRESQRKTTRNSS